MVNIFNGYIILYIIEDDICVWWNSIVVFVKV